jgi:hypothetical protein
MAWALWLVFVNPRASQPAQVGFAEWLTVNYTQRP